MLKQIATSFSLILASATLANACSPDDTGAGPGKYGPAPACGFFAQWNIGGPVIDIGNGRIIQPVAVGLATHSCGTGYKFAVYDCRSDDVGRVKLTDDDALWDEANPEFDFKRWTDAGYSEVLEGSAIGARFKRLAKRSRSGFIKGVEWTRPSSYISQKNPADIPQEMRCACEHFYPELSGQ